MSTLTLRPNADVASNVQLIGSDGNTTDNYALIDEASKDEADYVKQSGIITGEGRDTYSFPDHSTESGTIDSVKVSCYCKKIITGTDATAVYVTPRLRLSSIEYLGTEETLTASTALYSHTWATNPNTTAAWGSDWAIIDAIQAGLKLSSHNTNKSNYVDTYCYQLWVEVTYGEGGGATVKPHYYYLQQ